MVYKYDFLIIGAGVAGMSYALKVAREKKGKICMICKTSLEEANTSFAQGGVASVTNLKVDNFEKHIEDTMIAGDYISDRAAVEQVVRNAPAQIQELVNWGVNFDRKEDGSFDLHREGGHSEFRILHHADDTGAEIQRGLMEAVRNNPDIDVKEYHFAVEIITQHHLGARVTRRTPYINCYGAYVLNPDTQNRHAESGHLSLESHRDVHGRLRSGVYDHFQSRHCYGRRHCHGVSRQGNGGRHGVRAVPSHGAA